MGKIILQEQIYDITIKIVGKYNSFYKNSIWNMFFKIPSVSGG